MTTHGAIHEHQYSHLLMLMGDLEINKIIKNI
jgi:hypothetical protein